MMMAKTKASGKTPIFYGYVISFEARNLQGLSDCNVHTNFPTLCQQGANFIRNNRARIIDRYTMQASKVAEIMGAATEAVFLIEPDYWLISLSFFFTYFMYIFYIFFRQYYGDYRQAGGTLTGDYARSLFDDIALAIKKSLPKALISWDIRFVLK